MTSKQHIKREARYLLRLCCAQGVLYDERALQVARDIARHRTRNRFALLDEFRRLVALAVTRRTASVESAIPLAPEVHKKVQARLERLYGQGLKITFVANPRLIGGMRIKVGNDIYDGSVQGRLAALAARM